jgi:hypothetical protein
MRRALFASLLVCAGCATGPEPRTVAEHDAAAVEHTRKAAVAEAQYNPSATMHPPAGVEGADRSSWMTYNPTEPKLAEADAELAEAAEHAKAARALEAFENEACQGIPVAERGACPLLASQVSKVQHLASGLELTMKSPEVAELVSKRLNCHLAFAVANGFDRPSCPFLVEGMTVRLVEKGVLELTAPRPEAVRTLHQQARKVFAREAPLSKR